MIERNIVIGLIVSKEFLQQLKPIWVNKFLVSVSAQRLAAWCFEYYDEFNDAPGRTIADIYYEKLRTGELPKKLAPDIEDSLEDLSEEYDDSFNLKYALKRANSYVKERHLEMHQEKVKELMESGDTGAAEALAASYKGLSFEIQDDLDLGNPSVHSKIRNAFKGSYEPLIKFPGALGKLWNHQFVRGGFVSLMAAEKRGKTFWLMEIAVRASQQRVKVAFFQAGDMTENQQLRRICSYLTKKPVNERYLGKSYSAVVDCFKNQLDSCDKPERQCTFGPLSYEGKLTEDNIRSEVTKEQLVDAMLDSTGYKTCMHCEEFQNMPWGTPWLKEENVKSIVTIDEAQKKVQQFFIDKKRKLRISSHLNDTLSISIIRQVLDRWENNDGFIPDVIIIDYADLLVPSKNIEFRHQQNQIWKELRALSQERNNLLITATQTDADSYEKDILSRKNFSEDKRKFAHVTAMYGLNQDRHGREKKIGIMRINEIVIREGDFDTTSCVTVLQNLNLGRPFTGSYI